MFCKDGAVLDVEAPRVEKIDTTKTFRIASQNLVKREYMFARVKDKLLVSIYTLHFLSNMKILHACQRRVHLEIHSIPCVKKADGTHVEGPLTDFL